MADQTLELMVVVLGLGDVLGIAFPLVPNHSPNRIGANGDDHCVIDMSGILVPKVGRFGNDGRSERPELILHGLPPVDLRIVLGQFLLVSDQGLFVTGSAGLQPLGRFVI